MRATCSCLPNRVPEPTQFTAFLDWARTQYKNIYFIGGGGTALQSKTVAVMPVATEVFQIPEWSADRYGSADRRPGARSSTSASTAFRVRRKPLRPPAAACSMSA